VTGEIARAAAHGRALRACQHRALFLNPSVSFMRPAIPALAILLAMSTPITARAQSATVQGASSCIYSNPTVAVSGVEHPVGAGATVHYSVTVTSGDSAACLPSTFHLRGWVEEGWTVDIQPLSLTIAAGRSAQATLRVTSPASASARPYYAWAGATDTSTPVHNGQAGATYTVMSGCFLMPPSMAAAPVVQSGLPGATFLYDVTITNRDAAPCPPTTFRVQPEVPANWPAISPSSLVVVAGQSKTVRVALTAPRALEPSTYSLYARATDGPNTVHAASAELTYTVMPVVVAPRPPSGLVATARPEMKQIQLHWTGSSADAGYVILRNGVAAGVTISPSWTDATWNAGDTVIYSVVATDFGGRKSAPSKTATVRLSKTP
jgi:hypothetical protein